MKITDIIRGVLDVIDRAEEPEQEPVVAAVELEVEPAEELADMQRLAGLLDFEEPEYANAPVEIVAPIGAAFPAGDDVHHSKNPADIRTNAPSMFPGWQAGMK
jgi:hypothetical protein